MMRKILKWTLIALGLSAGPALAQVKEYTINFNDKGELYGNLPATLFLKDKLKFSVNAADDPVKKFQGQLMDQVKKLEKRIDALLKDHVKLNILMDVYNISETDLKDLKKECAKMDTDAMYKGTDVVNIPHLLKSNVFDLKIGNTAAVPLQVNDPYGPYTCVYGMPGVNTLSINLTRNDLYKQMVYNYLKDTKELFTTDLSAETISSLKEQKKNYDPLKTAAEAFYKENFDKVPTVLADLNALTLKVHLINQGLTVYVDAVKTKVMLFDDKPWILKWLWYQDGLLPLLNPTGIKRSTDLLKGDTTGNQFLQNKIDSRKSLLKSADYAKIPAATIDGYINDMSNFKDQMQVKLTELKKAQGDTAANLKKIKAFANDNSLLNQSVLFLSVHDAKGPLYIMRHHDAINNDQLMDEHEIPEYTEDDHVVLLVHNLKANEKAVISLSYQAIANPQSHIADDLTSTYTSLEAMIAAAGGLADLNKQDKDDFNEAKKSLYKELEALRTNLSYLSASDYLLTQGNPGLPDKEVTDSLYHTQKQLTPMRHKNEMANYTVSTTTTTPAAATTTPAAAQAPATTVTVTVSPAGAVSGAPAASGAASPAGTTSTAKPAAATTAAAKPAASGIPADTFIYRVNKLYRILPMGGIAATFPGFSSVDAKGVVSKESQVHVFAGVKAYIQKTDIRNTSFFTGKDLLGRPLLWSRLHFDAAFDVKNPLNNLYGGAGLDLWPGFSINMGAVFNKYTYYQFNNGASAISESNYRTGFYVAVSTDASLITQFIKLFK